MLESALVADENGHGFPFFMLLPTQSRKASTFDSFKFLHVCGKTVI